MGVDSSGNDEGSYLSWLAGKVDRARRPAFVSIARARLQRDFAVLLMRTSYQVCTSGMGQAFERSDGFVESCVLCVACYERFV